MAVNVDSYYGMTQLVHWYSRALTPTARGISPEQRFLLPMAAKAIDMYEREEPVLARYYRISMPEMIRFYEMGIKRSEPILAIFYASVSSRPLPNAVASYYIHGLDGIDGRGDWLATTPVYDDMAVVVPSSTSESDDWSEVSELLPPAIELVKTLQSRPPRPPRPPQPMHKIVEAFGNGLAELVANEWPFSSHLPVGLLSLRKMAKLIDDDSARFCQQCNQVFGKEVSIPPFANRAPPPTCTWKIEVLPPPDNLDAHSNKRHLRKEKSAAEAWESLVVQAQQQGGLMAGNHRCHLEVGEGSIRSNADSLFGDRGGLSKSPLPARHAEGLDGSHTRVLCPRGCALFRSIPTVPSDLVDAVKWALQVAETNERFWLAEVSCYEFCARTIQRAWCRRQDEQVRSKRDSTARYLQRAVRQRAQIRMHRQRESACLRLQPVMRGWIVRTWLRSQQQAHAAAVIVAVWRGHSQRTSLRRQYSEGMASVSALADAAPLPVIVKLLAARRQSQGQMEQVTESAVSSLTIVPPQQSEHGMQFDQERGSDVELTVHGPTDAPTKFWCHRAMLSRCGYFNSLFTGNRDPRYSTRLLRESVHLPTSTIPQASVETVRHALCWIYGHRFTLDRNEALLLHTLATDLGCPDLADSCTETAVDHRLTDADNIVSYYMQACQTRHGQPIANRCWRWITAHAAQLCAAGPDAIKALSPRMTRHLIATVGETDVVHDGGAALKLALRIAVHWAAADTRQVRDLTEVFDGCRWHPDVGSLFPMLPGGPGFDEENGVVQPAMWKHLVDRLSKSEELLCTFGGSDGSEEDMDVAAARPFPPPLPASVAELITTNLSTDEDRSTDGENSVDVDRLLEEAFTGAMHASLRDEVRLSAGLVPLNQPVFRVENREHDCKMTERLHVEEGGTMHSQSQPEVEQSTFHSPGNNDRTTSEESSSESSPDSDDSKHADVVSRRAHALRKVPPPSRPVVLPGGRRLAFQWSTVPKDVPGQDSFDADILQAELTLRGELAKLSVTGLQERAFAERVDATAVADASLDNEDESDKRRALIKLLVEHVSSARSPEVTRGEATGKPEISTRDRRRARVPVRPKGKLAFGRISTEVGRLPHVPASNLEPSLQQLF
eukprot:COSAG02_NODE_5511_length_4270_cov_25.261158_3_plen_1120_part_00